MSVAAPMETLAVERRDAVLLVRLDRPRRRNAINAAMLDALDAVLDRMEDDDTLRALVVTGGDQAFSAGQDLKEPEPPGYVARINGVFDRLEALPKATVAAIAGWCLAGGLELALACDLRLAAADARIGDWHARIQSIGGAGATVRLVRTVGLARAKELVFTGRAVSGDEAAALGLVTRACPAASLVDEALALAREMCTGDAVTFRHAKQSLHAAMDLSLAEALAFSLLCQQAVRSRPGRDPAAAAPPGAPSKTQGNE